MMKKISIYIISAVFILMNTGCTDWLEVEPEGLEVVDNLINDKTSAVQAVNGAYQPIATLYGNVTMQSMLEPISDDVWVNRGADVAGMRALDRIETQINTAASVWGTMYKGINRTNVILAKIDNVPFTKEEDRNNIKGHAYFLRAYYYFYLTSLFGDVPLITKEISSIDGAKLPRTPMTEVMGQVFEDVEMAISLLPEDMDGTEGKEKGKADRYAAYALKAYASLTVEDWDETVSSCNAIINSGKYGIVGYRDIFHNDNPEYGFDYSPNYNKDVILDVRFESPYWENFTRSISPEVFTDGNGIVGAYGITDNSLKDIVTALPASGHGLIDEFEENDQRLDVYFYSSNSAEWNDALLYECLKYWNNENPILHGGVEQDINWPLFRYSEVLLMKAEALNELSAGDAEAVDIINNMIRDRAGLPALDATTTSNQESFRQAIWKERRTELVMECKRFFDLNRTGRVVSVLVEQQDNIAVDNASKHMITNPITGKPMFLFAIPQGEMDANPNITENNPGY